MAMTAVRAAAGAGAPASLSRFRGALVAAVLGDCIGGEFEGAEEVPMENVLRHLSSLDDDTKGDGILEYSDDTAMSRCVVQSLLTRAGFDEQDMARRFAKEYSVSPGRGYGSGVIQVLKKLSSPQLSDVFQPARDQFNGRGSFGNGGAMRVAPFALAFPDYTDVKRDLMDRSKVSIEEVISELGNGIAALHSVPTAIFCVLYCLQPRESLPANYGGLERTMAYSLALGGDTDTIACMAGAIAGAHYGIEAIPQAWIKSCEGAEDANVNAGRLHSLYHQSPQGGGSGTGKRSCGDGSGNQSNTSNSTEKKRGAE
ncbi:ADP-ribosylhydrolase ARH3-like [Diretmus argenteus]